MDEMWRLWEEIKRLWDRHNWYYCLERESALYDCTTLLFEGNMLCDEQPQLVVELLGLALWMDHARMWTLG